MFRGSHQYLINLRERSFLDKLVVACTHQRPAIVLLGAPGCVTTARANELALSLHHVMHY